MRDNCYRLIRQETKNKSYNQEVIALCNRQLIDIERRINDIVEKIKDVISDLKILDAKIIQSDNKINALKNDYSDASLNRRKLSLDLTNSIISEAEFLDKNRAIDNFLRNNKKAYKVNIEVLCDLNAKRNTLEEEYKALLNKKKALQEKRDTAQRNKKIAIKNVKNCDINIREITEVSTRIDEFAFDNVTTVLKDDVTPKLKSMKKIKK